MENPARASSAPISPATEDYLKALYKLGKEAPASTAVSTKALAEALEVTAPSATQMVKRLADRGLVRREPYQGATLTKKGTKIALEVLRHHRLLELYFKEVLDYSWDELHEEAERLEHHISETFEDKLDELLGFPTRDPHGHPIPARSGGAVEEVATDCLTDLAPGTRATICHLADEDPALLEHLEERGLMPGATLAVVETEAFEGPITVQVAGQEPQLVGRIVAQSVFVRSQEVPCRENQAPGAAPASS